MIKLGSLKLDICCNHVGHSFCVAVVGGAYMSCDHSMAGVLCTVPLMLGMMKWSKCCWLLRQKLILETL